MLPVLRTGRLGLGGNRLEVLQKVSALLGIQTHTGFQLFQSTLPGVVGSGSREEVIPETIPGGRWVGA